MGIMYKLMKHKHCLEMDLAKRNERRTTTHKKDTQFTAEYIIELCKFLAEKSQRNKQKQQIAYEDYNVLNTSFDYEEIAVEMETFNDMEMNDDHQIALPLLVNHKRLIELDTNTNKQIEAKEILTAAQQQFNIQKIVPITTAAIATATTKTATTSTSTTSMLQFQQDNKKDILQKIRNQIFERKRQRQLASMQRIGNGNNVWRPW